MLTEEPAASGFTPKPAQLQIQTLSFTIRPERVTENQTDLPNPDTTELWCTEEVLEKGVTGELSLRLSRIRT